MVLRQVDLLEREGELARAAALLREAREGHGRLLAFVGPAGIGKTALLDEVCLSAEAAGGFTVLRARGGELERGFPHGVVRQLLETHLRGLAASERARLLRGAAQLAAPVVAPDFAAAGEQPDRDASFAVMHGLYWLTANMTDRAPLVLAVDDAQWADRVSLRFLVHLARRLEGMGVLVAVCVRSGEPDPPEDLLSALTAEGQIDVLRPQPLTLEASARLIRARLGDATDREFAAACHRASGGTPFLLVELITALRERGVAPTGDAASAVEEVGPQTVARAILTRLGRLPPGASELARAVAVLGADARLNRAARLAVIPEDEAIEASDALVAMSILRAGFPLEFVHPVVREAVYDDLPPAARAAAHARAADLLTREHAEPDAVATHLLLTEPAARRESVDQLREAAAGAVSRGAPESAVTYLRRALAEGGVDTRRRASLLFELGRAAGLTRPADGIEHLREARGLASDPIERAQIAHELVNGLMYMTEWDAALAVTRSTLDEIRGVDDDLALRFEVLRAVQEFLDLKGLSDLLRRLPELRALATRGTPAGRSLAAVLAAVHAWLGVPALEVRQLLEVALDAGRLPIDEGGESMPVALALQALILTDDLDGALELVAEALADSQRRASVAGVALALAHRGWVSARRGDLRAAEADLRTTMKIVRDHQVRTAEFGFVWYFTDAIAERPELDDEARWLADVEVAPTLRGSVVVPLNLETRGRIRLAHGDVAGAIEDLGRCAEIPYAHGTPNGWGWRAALAVALAASERDRALQLARAQLDGAGRVGLPRAIGVGLRALGLVEGGEEGLAHLEQSVQVLADSPARLEYARSLVELGAGRRRTGKRAAAREPLREGLDLAYRCGATRLEARARAELAATGARPRRALTTGRDALTPSEERVAAMAAAGMSNPEIAQALFVTRKTIENHLGRIYAKLAINSREDLPRALSADDTRGT